jgi:hypothetical protein
MISPMRPIFFLTLVLIHQIATASPDSIIPPEIIDTKPNSKWEEIGDPVIQTRVHHAKLITFSVGDALGTLVDQGENVNSPLLGAGLLLDGTYFKTSMEVEVTMSGLVGGNYRRHWQLYSNQLLELSYSLGLGALYKPQEELGSFINFERYQGRMGIGIAGQSGFFEATSFDFQIGVGTLGATFYIKLNYLIPD